MTTRVCLRDRLTVLGLAAFSLCFVSACAPSTMFHGAGHLFEPDMEITLPNSAWIAVDSCATGVHAIVELELMVNRSDIRPESDIGEPGLSFSPVQPLDVQLLYDGPVKATRQRDRLTGPLCAGLPREYGVQRPRGADIPDARCLYVYRIEFALTAVPKDPGRFRVQFGEPLSSLALSR